MIKWTPSTAEVRAAYASDELGDLFKVLESKREFDRWLEAHDREVAAESWEEGFRNGRAKAEYGIYTNRLERNPYKNGETL